MRQRLREALAFHASFDHSADADFARGDRRIHQAENRTRRATATTGGLGEDPDVRIVANAGRHGGALEYVRATTKQYFYRGPENLAYKNTHWSGTLSFWLKLDPDRDLPSGYSDPVQFVDGRWTGGAVFAEFSKETPRHFRFVMMPVTRNWNPDGKDYDTMTDDERPIVAVHRPPFSRDRWVHVLCVFRNLNSGAKDGTGELYLDGEKAGSMGNWVQTFEWDPAVSALTLGLNFVGLIDDLAVFDRPLEAAEIRELYGLRGGVADLEANRRRP